MVTRTTEPADWQERAMTAAELRDWKPDPAYADRMRQAKHLARAAQCTKTEPAPQATNEVHLQGEPLSAVLWCGIQWAVTTSGLECRDGCYLIEKHRLWEDEPDYDWVLHMADKNWVNLPDFAEALRIARQIHAPKAPP
jgi:hypothetical protein